jgi:DNA polymerase III epsilon subunit-like protein
MDGHLFRYNKEKRYTILDIESFNLNLSFLFNRPWQISLLNIIGDKVVEEKDIRIDWSKVAPNLKIGNEAARITHFDPILQNKLAIQPEEAFNIFWNDLKQTDHLIMHNGLRFDLYLLRGFAEYMNEDWKFLMPKIIDTKSIAQGIKMGVPYSPKQGNFLEYQYRYANAHVRGIKTSLKTLCQEFGIEYRDDLAHDGLYDITRNKLVWDRLKFQIES